MPPRTVRLAAITRQVFGEKSYAFLRTWTYESLVGDCSLDLPL